MRIAYLLIGIVAWFNFCGAPSASAGGPFGLFSDRHCCDSTCDACCGVAGGDCDSVCDSGCDTCGCGDHQVASHALGNLFRRDCCTGTYCSLMGGWNSINDYNGDDSEFPIPPPTPAIRRGTFNDGWTIGAAHGRRFNRAVRGELEFAFRSNTASEWFVNGAPAGAWSGHFYSYSIMANLYHDFANCSVMGWTPYAGAGVGIAFLDGNFQTAALDLEIDDQEFAYQFMAGGSRSLTSSVDLFLEYRYFATTDFDLVNNTPVPPVEFGEDAYEANNLFFGFRLYR